MQKSIKLLFTLCCALTLGTALADSQPTTFVGPTLQATYAGWFSPSSAYSILGELGAGNYRINLSAGSKIDDSQRVKVAAEYLWQDINYLFTSGQTKQWVQQAAAGLDYEYFVGCAKDHSLEFSAYASHAPNKQLSTAVIVAPTPDGFMNTLAVDRRIAGSNAFGLAGGVNFYLWQGSKVGVNLDFDDVRYTKSNDPMFDAAGLGATVSLQQMLGEHARINLLAAARKPFNNYQASVNWDNINYLGRWGVGVFSEYTQGRQILPSTWNLGLNLNYYADCLATPPPMVDYKNETTTAGQCFTEEHPYLMVPAPCTTPMQLSYRPPQLGPRLPMTFTTYNGRTRS